MGQLADFSLDQMAGACALVLGSLASTAFHHRWDYMYGFPPLGHPVTDKDVVLAAVTQDGHALMLAVRHKPPAVALHDRRSSPS
jgi:hypothetical protein